ncbi:MAG TPA: hypothetical protein VML55_03875 [Planctomycetaceae bacterium]|nr:hypothetical protein [Planctomycetaceae bacterium]
MIAGAAWCLTACAVCFLLSEQLPLFGQTLRIPPSAFLEPVFPLLHHVVFQFIAVGVVCSLVLAPLVGLCATAAALATFILERSRLNETDDASCQ